MTEGRTQKNTLSFQNDTREKDLTGNNICSQVLLHITILLYNRQSSSNHNARFASIDFTLSLLSLWENGDLIFSACSGLYLCVMSMSKGVIYFC